VQQLLVPAGECWEPTGVVVETFESYHGERAHRKILALLDTNHDGTLTVEALIRESLRPTAPKDPVQQS